MTGAFTMEMERKRHTDMVGFHFGRDGAHFQVASCGVASRQSTMVPTNLRTRVAATTYVASGKQTTVHALVTGSSAEGPCWDSALKPPFAFVIKVIQCCAQ